FECLEMLGPARRFKCRYALLALPAHAMKEKRAVARDQSLLARGEDEQRRRGTFAQHDAGALQFAHANKRGHCESAIDTAAEAVDVEGDIAFGPQLDQILDDVVLPGVDVADESDFERLFAFLFD